MTWKKRPLGEVASIDRNGVPPESISDGMIYVGLENMTGEGTFLNVREVDNGELASTKFSFDETHVLYGKLRPYLRKTTRPNFQGVCSTDILPISAGADLNRDFLYHFLRLPETVDLATTRSAGANLPRISPKVLEEFEIPVPSLPEQERIAEVLDKADALRQKRRLALQKLDSLLQSVFVDMFGDPIRNPKEWPKQPMEEIMKIRRGGSPRPIDNFLGGEYNWIKIGDATSGNKIYLESCKEKIIKEGLNKTVFLKSGSLIFANCGVSLGFARILKIDGCIHDGWLSFEDIHEEKLNKIFLLKALNSITMHFRAIAPDGTQPNLNTAIMKKFQIIIPPIEKQTAFANFVEKTEELRDKTNDSAEKTEMFFRSLQNRAFKGELFGNPIDAA